MLEVVLLFLVGLILLVVSTRYFIKAVSRFPYIFAVSPLVVGTTVVAIGTSLPELAVSSMAAIQGDSELGMSNIIGSNIVNVLLIMAVAIVTSKLRVGTSRTQNNIWMLLCVSVGFVVLSISPVPPKIIGVVMLVCAAVFSIGEYMWRHQKGGHKAPKLAVASKKRIIADLTPVPFSLLGVATGGVITVLATERLAAITGISTTIFGLTLTAIGTSLPELFATIFSERDGEEKIALGNILGSNVYNLALVGGIVFLLSEKKAAPAVDWLFFVGSTSALLAIVTLYKGRIIPKWVGLLLGVGFVLYILTVAAQASA